MSKGVAELGLIVTWVGVAAWSLAWMFVFPTIGLLYITGYLQ